MKRRGNNVEKHMNSVNFLKKREKFMKMSGFALITDLSFCEK